jgi:phosphatidylglycerophosphatase A
VPPTAEREGPREPRGAVVAPTHGEPDASDSPDPRPRPNALPLGPRLLATFLGTGLLRPGPGTWTSAAAALPLLPLPSAAYPLAVGVASVVAYFLCVALAAHPRHRAVLDRDPGWFTLDEVCGVWIAAWRHDGASLVDLGVAFVLFRVFDIAKPPPIRRSQFAPGGHGIVLDDALAGLFALALGYAVRPFLPS